MTKEQRKSLISLRNIDGYRSAPAYIFSSPVQGETTQFNTNYFFLTVTSTAAGAKKIGG